MPTLVDVHDPDDPRIEAYRDIRERDLVGRAGLFVAEGKVVVEKLVGSALHRPISLLIAGKRLDALGPLLARLPDDVPVFVAAQPVLDVIAGFPMHRGILAIGRRVDTPAADAVLAGLHGSADVLLLSGIANHDNMGGVFRNAAAFGAGAVLLDDRCCDPFYRKAIRVSVGAVLRTPMAAGLEALTMIEGLQAAGFEVLALTPGAPEALESAPRGGRVAILLGPEGPGLPPAVIERCRPIGIPMSGGFDSLNVSVASGIALHHFTRRA